MLWIRRLLAALAALLVLAVSALWGLSRLDARFRVTDWRIVISALTGLAGPARSMTDGGKGLRVLDGYVVRPYAVDVPNARTLRVTSAGDLLVAQPRLGQVLLLGRDADGNGQPDRRVVLLAGRNRPYGLDIADGWLYVGEGNAVVRVRFDATTGTTSGNVETVLAGLPEGGNHWTRTLRVGPDGWLYVTVGSSCNVCIEDHPWRAAMLRMRTDGRDAAVYANGLRNSVGFDWAPWNGELFATDNGRDLLGDDFPPCELNRLTQGGFYGWPYVNGQGVADPDYGSHNPDLAARALPPAFAFRAHNAPLGMTFLRSATHAAIDARSARSALVALHGSWNRSAPDGYRVVQLLWDEAGQIREREFLGGFEHDGEISGRPADVAEDANGNVYVSDDYAGAVYLVRPRRGGEVAATLAAPGATATSGVGAAPRADPLAGIDAAARQAAAATAASLMERHACVTCHVPGSVLAAKWATLCERHSVDSLANFFVAPTPPMPVFPLTDNERRQLAIHLLASAS